MKLNVLMICFISYLILGCGPSHQIQPKQKPLSLASKVVSQPKSEPMIERERVATLELTNKAGLKTHEVSYLSNLVRQAAGQLPQNKYGVITKENILVMLPQGQQLEDCNMGCVVQTGREIGAHWVVTGDLVKFGGELRLSLSLHHSASGELIASDIIKGIDINEIELPLEWVSLMLFVKHDPSLIGLATKSKNKYLKERERRDLRERELREQKLREQKLREQKLREQEQKLRERELRERERELRERELRERERELRERELRERELRERELRERELREQKLREQKLRERELRERELREQKLREQKLRERDRTFKVYEVFDTYKDPHGELYLALKLKPYPKGKAEGNKLLAKLQDGTRLMIINRRVGYKNSWLRVKVLSGPYLGMIGFVHSKWVRQSF